MVVLDPDDVAVPVVTQRRLGEERVGRDIRAPLLLQRVRLAELEVVLHRHVVEELPEDAVAKAVVVQIEELAVHPDGDAMVRVHEELRDGVALRRVLDDFARPAHPACRVLHAAAARF